jgi:ArsR family transcriptional regulator
MKQLIRVMKALGDPNRIRILKMLEQREMCVCEICAALGIAQPTVSSHLKVLEAAELVVSRRDGLWVNYRLDEAPGSAYARDMQRQLATWLNNEPGVLEVLDQLPSINRRELTRKVAA